jgi:hypothetical protein
MSPLLKTVHGGEVDAVFVQILHAISLLKVQKILNPGVLVPESYK